METLNTQNSVERRRAERQIETDLNETRVTEAAMETLDELIDIGLEVSLTKGDFAGSSKDYAANFVASQMELAAVSMAHSSHEFSQTQIKEALEQQVNNPFTWSKFEEKINAFLADRLDDVVQGFIAASDRVKSIEHIDERCKVIREIAAEREYPLFFVDQAIEKYRQEWLEDFRSESNLVSIMEEELSASPEKMASFENILDQNDLESFLELGAHVRESNVYEDISRFAQSAWETLFIQKARQHLESIEKNIHSYRNEINALQKELNILRNNYHLNKPEQKGGSREEFVRAYQEQVAPLNGRKQALQKLVSRLEKTLNDPARMRDLFIQTLQSYGDTQAEEAWNKFEERTKKAKEDQLRRKQWRNAG